MTPTAFPQAPSALLGQAGGAAADVILWGAIIIGLIIVGALVVYAVRNYTYRENEDADPGGFTLHDLRVLHQSGQLSDEEFESARAQLIGRLRGDEGTEAASESDGPDNAEIDDSA